MYYIDIEHQSINKKNEELCGDKVEFTRLDDGSIIAVLSDGLGSGVKANILATLTSKIATSMLSGGASISETVETIVNTLPECQVRKLAYSTFTIIKINSKGKLYMAEYENPPAMIFSNGRYIDLPKKEVHIAGKTILECEYQLHAEDSIAVVSDGAIHAGVGMYLNLGWQWENVKDYIENLMETKLPLKKSAFDFIDVCNNLYGGLPGDDTTVMMLRVKNPQFITLFTGPPVNQNLDQSIVRNFVNSPGKKIICGGTTANIVSKEIHKNIEIDLSTMTSEIPPIAHMEGIDLVTEGVLTLKGTLEIIQQLRKDNCIDAFDKSIKNIDGSSRLANLIINHCTTLKFIVGTAVNPAHLNPDFPTNFNFKIQLVEDLAEELRQIGKKVIIEYY